MPLPGAVRWPCATLRTESAKSAPRRSRTTSAALDCSMCSSSRNSPDSSIMPARTCTGSAARLDPEADERGVMAADEASDRDVGERAGRALLHPRRRQRAAPLAAAWTPQRHRVDDREPRDETDRAGVGRGQPEPQDAFGVDVGRRLDQCRGRADRQGDAPVQAFRSGEWDEPDAAARAGRPHLRRVESHRLSRRAPRSTRVPRLPRWRARARGRCRCSTKPARGRGPRRRR